MEPDPTPSPAARAWLDAVEPRGRDPRLMPIEEAVTPLLRLTVPDLIALGFDFAGPQGDFGQRVLLARPAIGLPAGLLTVMIAPGGRRALLWDPDGELRLWIDGREVALPRDPRGESLAEPPGGWSDEHLFAIEVVAYEHPGQDWTRVPGRGQIRGLLVCDAEACRERLELPHDDERWTEPTVERSGDRVLLFADAVARAAGTPSREWSHRPRGVPRSG